VFIDSHAHIDFKDFDADRVEVLQRARDAGIECIINPGSDLAACRRAAALAGEHEMIRHAAGIHPHSAKDVDEKQWQELLSLVEETDPVAIGEIGLDYHYDFSPRDVQQEIFKKQLRLAAERGLPVIVHCREAFDDCLQILREELGNPPEGAAQSDKRRGVMHCFSGSTEQAQECIELGFLISFAGNVTFKKAGDLRETAANVAVDKLLLETDSPYLAPQGRRGRRNEPAYVLENARVLADIHALEVEDIARITSVNARELFKLGTPRTKAEIVYKIRNSLYVNLTNRCSNRCIFCSRESDPMVKGHWLGLQREPAAEEVTAAIGDPRRYGEVVFCGFGEPTVRLDVLKKVAAYVKPYGVPVRLDTNGQGDIINGRKIAAELAGLVDTVSVSLNSADANQYVEICRPEHGLDAYRAVLEFIKDARRRLPKVIVTALDYPGVDTDACRRLAGELGVTYRQRKYNEVG